MAFGGQRSGGNSQGRFAVQRCALETLESRRLMSVAVKGVAPAKAAASTTVKTNVVVAPAAVLTINGGVQTYATLPDSTVTMSGKSELHITGSSAPITNTTINLTSQDSWVFFESIKPSVVNSTYLGQIKINGANAVQGTNVRVVQYELGTVVIPHASNYQALTAYTGPNFTGTARSFNLYTMYNTSAELAEQNNAVSSFKLKRGYMATLAKNSDGTGGKVYIAQDHDLDVSFMASGMDNNVQFVRVVPWRWVSKKGASDLGPTTLNSQWFYNWNNSASSSLDSEYVPIRQQRYWPGIPGETQKDVTHLLGFNEPDNPVEDAYETLGNGSIDTAVAVWPELEASGLRIGAPAVTDGGKAWLYEFMDKAIAAGRRVDYIPIHMYMANQTASSMYNWLKDIWDRYHKPIWVTEFNNGANWTTAADPTYAQNATVINDFIQMMDDTPWVERYAVYSRVEAVRQMTYDSGGLTPAGQNYYNNASPLSYQQDELETTNSGNKGIAQLLFNGNSLDSSGYGNNGQAAGAPTYVAGQRGQAMQLNGTNDYVALPERVARGSSFTFAGWVNWDGGANWQRIFDFGTGTNAYMFLSPSSGGNTLRFGIKNGGSEQMVETTKLTVGAWTHVAVTVGGGAARLYVNGTLAATNTAVTITPANVASTVNYIGKSQFSADPLFKGKLDDVVIRDSALTQAQIQSLMVTTNNAPQFAGATINAARVGRGVAYTGTVAGLATDADGDAITYAKASGPSWLVVNADGTLGGTPGANETVPQDFVITATDARGLSTSAVLSLYFDEAYWRGGISGAWTANTAGNTNWANDVAGTSNFGALPTSTTDVYFGTTNAGNLSGVIIGADSAVRGITVNSTAPVNIGGTNALAIGAGGLTLASGAGATTIGTSGPIQLLAPQTWANNSANNLVVNSVINGAFALTLNGSGTTVLGGNSIYSGGTIIGTNAGAAVVRATASNALGTGAISFDGIGNGSTARLELTGNITLPNAIYLPQRNSGTVAIQNLSGNNTLGGAISVSSGGSAAVFQSDSGLLTLAGPISSGSGSRTPTFGGAGNGLVTGAISDGAGNVSVVKNGAGIWTLAGNNTYTGTTTVSAGTLALGAADRLADTGTLVLAGGTFLAAGFSETLGAISMTENSTLDFGAGNSTLSFSNAAFSSGKTLSLKNYTPGNDRLFIGTSASLTSAQLAQINFGYAGITAVQLPTGEVVTSAPVVLPTMGQITVDNGTPQRSMVRSITVPFNTPVTLGSGAMTLWRRSTTGGAPVSVAFTRTANADGSVYTLTFSGAGTNGGSLSDGTYDLQFNAAAVTTSAGLSPEMPSTFTFKRLFGDLDGDSGVSILDFNAFTAAFGSTSADSSFVSAFDFDGDNGISINDFNQFTNRFGFTV